MKVSPDYKERKMNPETLPIPLYQTEPPLHLQGAEADNLQYFLAHLSENHRLYDQLALISGNNGNVKRLLLDIIIENSAVTFVPKGLQTARGLLNSLAADFIDRLPRRAEDLFRLKGTGRISYQLRKTRQEELEALRYDYCFLTAGFHERPMEYFAFPPGDYLAKAQDKMLEKKLEERELEIYKELKRKAFQRSGLFTSVK